MVKQSRLSVLDSQGEIGTLVGYLKANESNGEKFVYVSFSGENFGRPEMLKVINVAPPGFSQGLAALEIACAAPR